MRLGETIIDETFAEAFGMKYARVLVTAADEHWLDAALNAFTGFSTSIIGCDLEMGIETRLQPSETPDGRSGASVLAFGASVDSIAKALPIRAGQCLMTCTSTAAFDGLAASEKRIDFGKHIRFFGDGFQKSKVIAGRRYWRIPVMDGEFLIEDTLGVEKGVAGGNIIIQGRDPDVTRLAARQAVAAITEVAGVITPFPGGVARSGSKVGSRYESLRASTAEPFCPTLKGRVETKLYPDVNSVLEIVIDGSSDIAVRKAMRVAIKAAAQAGIVAISAGNYGGQLGPYHFHLHEILRDAEHPA